LAATLLSALGLLAWGLGLRRDLEAVRGPRADFVMLDLAPEKVGAERSAEAPARAYVRGDQSRILLLLNLGDLRQFASYRMELIERGKGVRWAASGVPRNEDGTFLLEIPAEQLRAKPYRVRLYGQDEREGVVLADYSFEIVRREKADHDR
jgi:hypothetical protein